MHHSIKITPNQATKKWNEKEDYTNLQDRRVRQQSKFSLGQVVRTADIKRVFNKGDSTNYSYILYTITEVIHDNIPSYRIENLRETFIENLLPPTKLTLGENNQIMKKLSLIE